MGVPTPKLNKQPHTLPRCLSPWIASLWCFLLWGRSFTIAAPRITAQVHSGCWTTAERTNWSHEQKCITPKCVVTIVILPLKSPFPSTEQDHRHAMWAKLSQRLDISSSPVLYELYKHSLYKVRSPCTVWPYLKLRHSGVAAAWQLFYYLRGLQSLTVQQKRSGIKNLTSFSLLEGFSNY